MKPKRFFNTRNANPALTVLVLLALPFFFSCSGQAEKHRIIKEELTLLGRYIENNRQTPSETVEALTEKPGTLIIAVPEGYAETPEWIRFLIPVLYNRGITELGVFFLSPEGSPDAESVTTPGAWNEKGAERALYLADPSWGYAEYRDLFAYTEHFNSLLDPGETRFRLRPLYKSRRFDDETALALAGTDKRAVFIIPQGDLETVADRCEGGRFGTVSVLLLYGPVEYKKKIIVPWRGILEKVMREVRKDRIPCGLPLTDRPATVIFRPDNRIDAILLIRPSRQFTPLTPIDDFVRKEDHADALARFPIKVSPTPVFRSIQKMNGYISDRARFWEKGAEAVR
jgi:hypothetical protein